MEKKQIVAAVYVGKPKNLSESIFSYRAANRHEAEDVCLAISKVTLATVHKIAADVYILVN